MSTDACNYKINMFSSKTAVYSLISSPSDYLEGTDERIFYWSDNQAWEARRLLWMPVTFFGRSLIAHLSREIALKRTKLEK